MGLCHINYLFAVLFTFAVIAATVSAILDRQTPGTIPIKIILVPSCGDEYGLEDTRLALDDITVPGGGKVYEVFNGPFPDHVHCRKSNWMPTILEHFVPGNTIVAGASTGALACMRLLENHPVIGAILLSAGYEANGDPGELHSGYYASSSGQWDFLDIASNAGWLYQFGADGDPYIPIEDQLVIHDSLPGSIMVRYPYRDGQDGHLGEDDYVFKIIVNKTAKWLPRDTLNVFDEFDTHLLPESSPDDEIRVHQTPQWAERFDTQIEKRAGAAARQPDSESLTETARRPPLSIKSSSSLSSHSSSSSSSHASSASTNLQKLKERVKNTVGA